MARFKTTLTKKQKLKLKANKNKIEIEKTKHNDNDCKEHNSNKIDIENDDINNKQLIKIIDDFLEKQSQNIESQSNKKSSELLGKKRIANNNIKSTLDNSLNTVITNDITGVDSIANVNESNNNNKSKNNNVNDIKCINDLNNILPKIITTNLNNNNKTTNNKKNIKKNISCFIELREDKENDSIVSEDTDPSNIDKITNNDDVLNELAKYNEFKDLDDYNINYMYELKDKALSLEELKMKWSKSKHIFAHCNQKKDKQIKIKDIVKIHSHFFRYNQLWYVVQLRDGDISYYLKISNCYSIYLFRMTHDYLFKNFENNDRHLTDATKFYEMLKFITRTKNYLDDDIDLQKVINSKMTYRKPLMQEDPNANCYYDTLDFKFNFFMSNDNLLGISINQNGIRNHFEYSEFSYYCSNDVFIEVEKRKDELVKNMVKEKMNMIFCIFKEKLYKMDRDKKRNFMNTIRLDIIKNSDNCLIHALRKISNYFNNFNNFKIFKKLSMMNQIMKVNEILSEKGEKLLLVNVAKQKVENYIQNCFGKSLLVFWNSYDVIHCEAINDGKFMDDLEPLVKQMIKKESQIRELKIVPINDYVDLSVD